MMECEKIVISWNIGPRNNIQFPKQSSIFGSNVTSNASSFFSSSESQLVLYSGNTKSINCLERDWTLYISPTDPLPPEIKIKRTSSGKFKITGYFVLHKLGSDISITGNIGRFLEYEESQVTFPIVNRVSVIQLDKKYVISGFLKISECPEENVETKMTGAPLLKLSKDLHCLLTNQDSSLFDINLKCGSDVFPAHKIILSARSEVFAAMFQNATQESETGSVDITDIDPSIIPDMLDYIYSGLTGDLTDIKAGQLLFAADKYQLEELKEICSGYLKSNISVDNALQILVLGDLHDRGLKLGAMDFIIASDSFPVLEEKPEWKYLLKNRTDLAIESLTFLLKSKCGRKAEGK